MSKSNFKIVFDAAGSKRTGVGHLVRSIALAERLRQLGAEVILLAKPKSPPLFVLNALRAVHFVTARYTGVTPQVIVVDRPDTDQERLHYLHRRWPAASIVALDYYGPCTEGLALTINLNEALEKPRIVGANASYRGLGFAILRSPFLRIRQGRRRAPKRVKRILVGFGGTDSNNWSQQTIQILAQCLPSNITIQLILGTNAIGKEQNSRSRGAIITSHVAVSDPAPFLKASDLAVIGGGSMLMEAACLGVPAVVLPRTTEEQLFARQFARAGAALVIHVKKGFPVKTLQRHVTGLLDDPATRFKMQQAGRQLIDGRGADRVAKLILQAARDSL